jgi:SAM-dependent methyltransferase
VDRALTQSRYRLVRPRRISDGGISGAAGASARTGRARLGWATNRGVGQERDPVTPGPQHEDAPATIGPPALDKSVANPARMWNYWLGGKDNYAVDRAAADRAQETMPAMPQIARMARRFLGDAVRQLAGDGIRQFLDIGSGLPVTDNTHEVAQRADPAARVVYVDYDPVVLNYAEALLVSSPEGATDYIRADLRDTGTILAEAARTLDLSQPVAILLIAVLHFIPDADGPYTVVRELMDALAPGSRLVIVHAASDILADGVAEHARRYNQRSPAQIRLRSREEITRFFDGLELTGPGVVSLAQWWSPDQPETGAAGNLSGYCGIAVKR